MIFFFISVPRMSRDGTGQAVKIPSCSVPSHGKILSFQLSLFPGTRKEFLSICSEKLHYPVPLETLIYSGWLLITIRKWITHFVSISKQFSAKYQKSRPYSNSITQDCSRDRGPSTAHQLNSKRVPNSTSEPFLCALASEVGRHTTSQYVGFGK